MDKATGPGIVLAFGGIIAGILLDGGNLAHLFNIAAFSLVFGGTLGVGLVGTTFETFLGLGKSLVVAFTNKQPSTGQIIETFVRLADKARREGLLALEQEAETLDPFCRQGVQLVVDGSDPHLVAEILDADIEAMKRRHKAGYSVLESMGAYAPTIGIIGTVTGLVHVLSNLSSPEALGESIAAAFIATLYGVGSANVLYLPIAAKLKLKSAEEATLRELMVQGILSVQAGDNPRVVRQKLEAQLSPKQREAAAKAAEKPAAAGAGQPAASAG